MITVLCGGFGAARFLRALRLATDDEICCVINTADDMDHLGLHISPDIDTILYSLAERFDEQRGFGLRGDTFHCVDALHRYTEDWFLLGDEDLATHLKRTAELQRGRTLSAVTRQLTQAWNVGTTLLPMTDQPVRTQLDTDAGMLPLQTWLVAHGAMPQVRHCRYLGVESASPAPGVLAAIRESSVLIFAPSNPISSIGPILAIPELRQQILQRGRTRIAVTPVVRNVSPRTTPERHRYDVRERLLAARGIRHSPVAIAQMYSSLIDEFVLDETDKAHASEITELGMTIRCANTLPNDESERLALGRATLGPGLAEEDN